MFKKWLNEITIQYHFKPGVKTTSLGGELYNNVFKIRCYHEQRIALNGEETQSR